jgi:hypothetical protein
MEAQRNSKYFVLLDPKVVVSLVMQRLLLLLLPKVVL